MTGYAYGMGVGGWIAVTVFWLALLTMVVWGISHALPSVGRQRRGTLDGPTQETPQETLDRRFVAGEMDEDAYRRMRTALRSGRPSGR